MTAEELQALYQANPLAVWGATAAVAVLLGVLLLRPFSSTPVAGPPPFLDPTAFKPMVLVEKRFVTHNTLHLKFALESPDQRLGLPVGQHMSFITQGPDGKDVYRSYTPVSDDDLRGAVEFVIKVYPEGKMSQALNRLQVGEAIRVKGPKGRLEYKPNMVKHIGMVAGGTGVTPMFQVLNAVLKNPRDRTKASLIFGNLTVDDILLRKELDALAQEHPQRVKVHYLLNTPPKGWSGGEGYVTPDMIKAHLPPPGPESLVLRCGPGPMNEAVKKHLDLLGYSPEQQFQF